MFGSDSMSVMSKPSTPAEPANDDPAPAPAPATAVPDAEPVPAPTTDSSTSEPTSESESKSEAEDVLAQSLLPEGATLETE